MKYFYSAAVMGYGKGRLWHKFYDFPNFERVTKTITIKSKLGLPFAVWIHKGSVYNRVSLHNPGILKWIKYILTTDMSNVVLSVSGDMFEIDSMLDYTLGYLNLDLAGVELNFSCPNAHIVPFTYLPTITKPLYLKLRYNDDPYKYELDKVAGIRLNSVPHKYGGVSGLLAKEKNWSFIKQFGKELNVAGCSFQTKDDLSRLKDMGCTEIGIGSTILTNPNLIQSL